MRANLWSSSLVVLAALAGCHRPTVAREEPAPAAPSIEGALAPAAPALPACARRTPGQGARPLAGPSTGSTVALARAGEHLLAYVADEDEGALRTVDIDAQRELSRVALGGRPSALLLAPDGRIVVALRDRAALRVFEPPADPAAEPAPLCQVETATEPVSLAATPDGATLLVVSRWDHTLALLDLATMSPRRSVDLPRDPQAVVASADGRKALVTHLAGAQLSVVDLQGEAAVPRALTTHLTELTSSIIHFMPGAQVDGKAVSSRNVVQKHERFGGQGYALARLASGRVLAPEVMVETGSGAGISGGYGSSISFPTVLHDVSVIDADATSLAVAPVRPAGGPTPCLLPRAAAVDERSGELLVACMGLDGVIAYGAEARLPVHDERRRFLVGAGPTGLAIDGEGRRAVVFAQFEGALDVLPLGTPRQPGEKRIDLSKPITGTRIPLARSAPLAPALALGRTLFHAASGQRLASDGRSCASCHPDGRDDALTWSTPDGPRQTPILLGRLPDTAPYGWDGDRPDLPSHFARTISRLHGAGISPAERDALFAYIQSLEAPRARDPKPEAQARLGRGSELFHTREVGCSSCHLGDDVATDRERHDVGSRSMVDATPTFDTPSLRFVARSAPYFHDGRYPTMAALIEGCDGTMGHTAQLTPADREALGAYVESL
jgi:DNA-binding beta-propeller fold protein YncE/mono/diheme cytochrome c family protein